MATTTTKRVRDIVVVAYRGADSFNPGTASVVEGDLQWPAGTSAGDLAVVWGAINNNTGTYGLDRPNGTDITASWTECPDGPQTVGSTYRGNCWLKVLSTQDITDGGIIVTNASSGRLLCGVMVISDPGAVEEFSAVLQDTNTTTKPWGPYDPLNTSFAFAVVGYNIAAGTPTTTAPAGWTERVDVFSTNGSGRRVGAWGATYDTINNANISSAVLTTNNPSHGAVWFLVVNEAVAAPSGFSGWGIPM